MKTDNSTLHEADLFFAPRASYTSAVFLSHDNLWVAFAQDMSFG